MKPTRPYLIRAFYEWIVESQCTPYIVVNAEMDDVLVPTEYIENGQIVLNVSMTATQDLHITNESIEFMARFHGNAHNVYVPIHAVLAIYASENGKGMVFNDEDITSSNDTEEFPVYEDEGETGDSTGGDDDTNGGGSPQKKKGKGHLTVVK